ncbi:19113_t:CDS:1, partial [Gigaspora margarita]
AALVLSFFGIVIFGITAFDIAFCQSGVIVFDVIVFGMLFGVVALVPLLL